MRLLPAAARTAVPWRNGGGVTRQVAAGPENAAGDLGWRISIATIENDGPFSAFPGMDRSLILLSGGPLTLIGPGWRAILDRESAPFRFDGDAAVEARIAAPATVLNVMTRRGAWDHAFGDAEGAGERILVAPGRVDLAGTTLEPLDALWLAPGDPAVEPSNAILVTLRATTAR